MASQGRFPRPSVVFLDGDQAAAPGCTILPGEDAPERVIFENLQSVNWPDVADRVGRSPSETIDALNTSMALSNHHDWIAFAGDRLTLGGISCGRHWRQHGQKTAPLQPRYGK